MNKWNIYALIKQLRNDAGLVTVMTSHDMPESIILSDRIVVISKVTNGTTAIVIPNETFVADFSDPAACLRAARDKAVPIEATMFPRYVPSV
jgi:ABC-type sulfate/molybdate transport systems ATPase subunit